MSSAYENVVCGRLKLKGKALDVKAAGGINKKKKKKHNHKHRYDQFYHQSTSSTGGNTVSTDSIQDMNEIAKDSEKGQSSMYDDHLTPAERRYIQQTERINLQRLAKMASKSHRDRIHEFNQYLANLTEHYDIPKVGPG